MFRKVQNVFVQIGKALTSHDPVIVPQITKCFSSKIGKALRSHKSAQVQNVPSSPSTDAPELDGALREVASKKILHYRQLYVNRPDPIAFLPAAVDTTGRVYDDFSRSLFLHAHRELRLWPTKYRRNRVNFASFVWLTMLILKGQWG